MSEDFLNWPPSRGPMPVTTKVVDYPDPVQEDVTFEQAPGDSEEQALIEGVLSTVSAELVEGLSVAKIPEDMTPEEEEAFLEMGTAFIMGEPPPEDAAATMESAMRRPRKLRKLVGEFGCDYHVATVAGLTLEQADRLLFVSSYGPESMEPCSEECECGEPHPVRELLELRCTWSDYEPRPLTVELTYPLGVGSKITLSPFTMKYVREGSTEEPAEAGPFMTAGYLLWSIAQEYKRVYTEHEHYKVWGHDMGDLYIEGFSIDEGGNVGLDMGS